MNDSRKKIYFASDFHLGISNFEESRKREIKIVKWLTEIEKDAKELFLLGDLFDFWFEYKKAVPKGFIRLLGKLAQLSDDGIRVHIFTGNHDIWMRDYFVKELNAVIYKKPKVLNFNGKTFYLAHGDALGPNDYGYKFINKIFNNKICQWLFKWLHPDIGIRLASFFSAMSRNKSDKARNKFFDENEWLIIHSRKILKQQKIHYFLYGHRHFPKTYLLDRDSFYINLGDMITHYSYAVFDGEKLELKFYE